MHHVQDFINSQWSYGHVQLTLFINGSSPLILTVFSTPTLDWPDLLLYIIFNIYGCKAQVQEIKGMKRTEVQERTHICVLKNEAITTDDRRLDLGPTCSLYNKECLNLSEHTALTCQGGNHLVEL